MTTTNPGPQTATNPAPHEGGSYVVGKDGKRVRQEFTLQPGEPGHGEPGHTDQAEDQRDWSGMTTAPIPPTTGRPGKKK